MGEHRHAMLCAQSNNCDSSQNGVLAGMEWNEHFVGMLMCCSNRPENRPGYNTDKVQVGIENIFRVGKA
jgi:hypothetical protein